MFDVAEERHYAYPNETNHATLKELLGWAFNELKLSDLFPDDEWQPLWKLYMCPRFRPELASWIFCASGRSEESREKRTKQQFSKQVELGKRIAVEHVLAIYCQLGSVRVLHKGDKALYQRVQPILAASPALNADPQPATDQPTDQPSGVSIDQPVAVVAVPSNGKSVV